MFDIKETLYKISVCFRYELCMSFTTPIGLKPNSQVC